MGNLDIRSPQGLKVPRGAGLLSLACEICPWLNGVMVFDHRPGAGEGGNVKWPAPGLPPVHAGNVLGSG
jgi:hypothetical protein